MQQHAPGLLSASLQLQQQALQLQMAQQRRQQQAQQLPKPASVAVATSASIPSTTGFVHPPAALLPQAQVSAGASLAPLAVQINAANLPFAQAAPGRLLAQLEQPPKSLPQQQQQQHD